MKKYFLVYTVLELCCTAQVSATPYDLETLASKYKSAQTEKEKMAVCIEAIDSRAIEVGVPVENVDKIFGTDFANKLPRPGREAALDGIHFSKRIVTLQPVGTPVHDSSWPGWFFSVKYASTGMVLNYYLSNCTHPLN